MRDRLQKIREDAIQKKTNEKEKENEKRYQEFKANNLSVLDLIKELLVINAEQGERGVEMWVSDLDISGDWNVDWLRRFIKEDEELVEVFDMINTEDTEDMEDEDGPFSLIFSWR